MKAIELARMPKKELVNVRQKFVIDKMELDKFFSDFLSENELDHDIPDTPEWLTYKSKLNEYRDLSSLIKWSEYYIQRNQF